MKNRKQHYCCLILVFLQMKMLQDLAAKGGHKKKEPMSLSTYPPVVAVAG